MLMKHHALSAGVIRRMSGGFLQVSKNFSDVFKQLVPNGKAQLVMKRAVDAVSAKRTTVLRPSHPKHQLF